MLILIGVAPTAYALNRAPPAGHADAFIAAAHNASKVVEAHGAGYNVIGDPRPAVTDYIHAHQISEGTYPSLAVLVKQISDSVKQYGSVAKTPLDKVQNVRNDMYLASEAIRVLAKDKESELSADEKKQIGEFKKQLDYSTKFIPLWVKICVAIALGLGTMVGWKRIVVTVGEKIGKTHLTYGQGAAAELVAAATIGAADGFGLPVSTTHVLSSGVAGTMVANGSGMQWSTVRKHRDGLGADFAGRRCSCPGRCSSSSATSSDGDAARDASKDRVPARLRSARRRTSVTGFARSRGIRTSRPFRSWSVR